MERVVDLSGYRAMKKGHPRDGIQMEVASPFMIVRHYREGVLIREERVISERLLRDTLNEVDHY